jgi:uncharacterized protein (UPF0332 family)
MNPRWKLWIENDELLERDFYNYLKKKVIREGATELEVKGHLEKSKRNLDFARRIIDDLKGYYEWSLVAYYYSVYQASLALCALNGFQTKSHQATICILIKFFYPRHISKKELEIIHKTMNEKDIQNLAELKEYREDATYSISINYEKTLAEDISKTAVNFVSKVEQILEES